MAKAGDFFIAEVTGQPVIVLRDQQGSLRALSNICAHRGSPLLEERGNIDAIPCPYHAWTYALDGRLRRAPFMENSPAFDPDRVCLPQFGIETWHGFVYVNLDAGAEPLAPRLAALDPVFSQYRVKDMTLAFCEDAIYACNWKVLCENFCESYHVFRVHPRTLEPVTPTRSVRVAPGGLGFNLHTQDFCGPREPIPLASATSSTFRTKAWARYR